MRKKVGQGRHLGALRERALFCKSGAAGRALAIGFADMTQEDAFESGAELLLDAKSDATCVFNVRVCKVTI